MVEPYDGIRTRQHPCSICGCKLDSNNMYDLVLSRRQPMTNHNRDRKIYIRPLTYTVNHIYLCNDCAEDVRNVMKVYEEEIQ